LLDHGNPPVDKKSNMRWKNSLHDENFPNQKLLFVLYNNGVLIQIYGELRGIGKAQRNQNPAQWF